MTFTLTVEHETTNGETLLDTFEGVTSFNNPPMVSSLHVEFADEREKKKLKYGTVVKADDET